MKRIQRGPVRGISLKLQVRTPRRPPARLPTRYLICVCAGFRGRAAAVLHRFRCGVKQQCWQYVELPAMAAAGGDITAAMAAGTTPASR
jgi:hypothetical protein